MQHISLLNKHKFILKMISTSRLMYYGMENYIKEQIFLIEHGNTGTKKIITRIKHIISILKKHFKMKLKRGRYVTFYTNTIPILNQIIKDLNNAKNSSDIGDVIMYLNWAKIRINDVRFKWIY